MTASTMAEREDQKKEGRKISDELDDGVRALVTYYRDSSSIHGVSQCGGKQFYTFRRKVWLMLVLLMVIGLTTLMYLHFERYSQHLTVDVLSAYVTGVLPFPAVTICNLNQFHRGRIPRDPRLKRLLYKMSDFSYIREYLEVDTASNQSANLTTGEELFEFAMNASHRLNDMFKFCVFHMKNTPCEELFKPTLTDLGVCYTFNADPDTARRHITDSGPLNGLRIILNIEQDAYFYSLYSQAGIKVVLHEPNDVPVMINTGFFVRPGTCTDVAIRREQTERLPAPYKAFGKSYCMDTKDPDFRSPLARYKNFSYSALGCFLDCFVNRMVDKCGCRHFYEYENISMEDMVHCTCPAPCSETRYVTSMSFTDFASKFIIRKMFHNNIITDRDFVRDNLIELRVYFDTLTVTEVRQEPEMTIMGILGTMGGHMGLFLGASLLSVSEVLEVLILVAFGCLLGRRGSPRSTPDTPSTDSKKITRNMEQEDSAF